jgi:hypothetical protein
MADENAHNKRYRLIRAAYFADWFQIERIWTSARKVAASKATGDALDDFLKEHMHIPPATDKTKE